MATMYDENLSRYIDRVRRIPTLSREAEHELALEAAKGDQDAQQRLVEANLRFVVAVALSYKRYGIPISELVAEGNVGLMIAARKFDADRGTRFVTYAGYWIRALILDLVVRSTTMVGAGSGPLRSKLFFRLRRERARISNLALEPAERNAIMAERFNTTPEKMEEMLRRLDARDVSLDQTVFGDTGVTMLDSLEDSGPNQESAALAGEITEIRQRAVADALAGLDKRERFIMEQRYMKDRDVSLASLGRKLGVSRERARQLEARAKQKLRDQLEGLDLVA